MSDINEGVPDESGFMRAAESAIHELQDQAISAKTSADDAAKAALRAEKSAKRWKRLTLVLGFFIVVLLVVAGVTGYYVQQTRSNTEGLRQQAIASCRIGNERATGTVTALNDLIMVLEGPKPTPQIQALAASLQQKILASNGQRDCQQAYQSTSNSADPSSLPPNVSTTASAPEVVQIKSWNGQCLTVANANTGTKITVVACNKAHDWWYYPEASNGGTFRPEGHASVALGDSGGYAALVPVSNYGSQIFTDGAKTGPSGYNYQRLYIAPLGIHGRLHANGTNGATVSVQTPVSNADFYALLGNISNNAKTV